jgi:hypothetical protein
MPENEPISKEQLLGLFQYKFTDLEYEESLLEDFKSKFKENFDEHYPKIIEAYAIVAHNLKKTPDEFVNKFNRRLVSACISRNVPWVETVILTHFFKEEDIREYLRNPELGKYILKYFTNGKDKEVNRIKWCLRHVDTEENIKKTILQNKIDVNLDDTVTAVKAKIIEKESKEEVKRIEHEYGYGDMKFKFDDCEFNLKYDKAENERYKAYIMEKGDTRMVKLGEYTCCCQELGENGETAMMHGLINPKAGFWVIENKETGKIYAQAEIWELDENTIVFDNIEFADGRTIYNDDIREMIALWMYGTKYQNVIMGTVNNLDLTYEMFDKVEFIVKPTLTAEELYMLDDDDNFDSFEEAKEAVRTGNYNYDDFVYTDVDDGNAVYLKKQNKIQDFLWTVIKDKVVTTADIETSEQVSPSNTTKMESETFHQSTHLQKIKESPINRISVNEKHQKRTMREILKAQIENDIELGKDEILTLWNNYEDFISDKYGLTFEDLQSLGIEITIPQEEMNR